MSAERVPTKNKIRILIFGLILFSILLYVSQATNLNHKAQRALSQILETPEKFILQVLDQYQEFESREIAKLKKDILNLQDSIYEKDLQIKSLENSKSYTSYSNVQKDGSSVYISSFDQMNFNCCKKHRIYISNPNRINEGIFAVSQGDFAIGKTRILSNNEIEVRLLSDPEEYISIKTTKEFFCIAKGDGEALTISCLNESKAVSYEIGDTFFTTGFDGIYPAGLIVGRLKSIENIENNLFRQKLNIELFFDPFKSINKRAILHE
mgnify:FL=1